MSINLNHANNSISTNNGILTFTSGIYTDNLRYAANGSPWVMGSGGGGTTTTITISPFLLGGM